MPICKKALVRNLTFDLAVPVRWDCVLMPLKEIEALSGLSFDPVTHAADQFGSADAVDLATATEMVDKPAQAGRGVQAAGSR